MRDGRLAALSLLSAVALACGGQSGAAFLEENKAVVREFFQAIDDSGGSLDFIDEWMTPDFQTHFNSPDAIDLAGYREFMVAALSAFPEMRHEIHYFIAEGDRVAAGITLQLVHSGEWQGIAPTGRAISVEEIAVVRLRNGKVAEEWVVFDAAGLQQQLIAPTADPQ